jgi:hypothetical protein
MTKNDGIETNLRNEASMGKMWHYIRVGYPLPSFDKKWKPYYRFAHTRVPAGEPSFHGAFFQTSFTLLGSLR